MLKIILHTLRFQASYYRNEFFTLHLDSGVEWSHSHSHNGNAVIYSIKVHSLSCWMVCFRWLLRSSTKLNSRNPTWIKSTGKSKLWIYSVIQILLNFTRYLISYHISVGNELSLHSTMMGITKNLIWQFMEVSNCKSIVDSHCTSCTLSVLPDWIILSAV